MRDFKILNINGTLNLMVLALLPSRIHSYSKLIHRYAIHKKCFVIEEVVDLTLELKPHENAQSFSIEKRR